MLGRSTNGQPWFVGQVLSLLQTRKIPDALTFAQQREVISQHLQSIYSFYGSYMSVRIAQKHIKWYVDRFTKKLI